MSNKHININALTWPKFSESTYPNYIVSEFFPAVPVTSGGNKCTIVVLEIPYRKEGIFLAIDINVIRASLGWDLLEFEWYAILMIMELLKMGRNIWM